VCSALNVDDDSLFKNMPVSTGKFCVEVEMTHGYRSDLQLLSVGGR